MTKTEFLNVLTNMGITVPKSGTINFNVAVDSNYRDSVYIMDKPSGNRYVLYVGYRNSNGVYEICKEYKFRLKHVISIGNWENYYGVEAIELWRKHTNLNKLMDKL